LTLLEVPLLAHGHAASADELALLNFLVEEGLDGLNLVVLSIAQVIGYFVQVEGSLTLVSVSHVLGFVLAFSTGVRDVLELEGRDGVGRDVQGQGGLVALVNEVPHVDSVSLGDEDDTGAGGAERTAGVVRFEGISRAVDGSILIELGLPNRKVEVVNGHDKLLEEGAALKSNYWAVVTFAVLSHSNVLSSLLVLTDGLDGPVNHEEVSLVRGGKESGRLLALLEEHAGEADLAGAVLAEEVDGEPWDPLIVVFLVLGLLAGFAHS
jgi:hypothetical protein